MANPNNLVQGIKRYLHQAKKKSDGSILVKFDDFYEFKSVGYENIVMALLAMQGGKYLKFIGLLGGTEGHLDEGLFDVQVLRKRIAPEYAKVVLAEDYGGIDDEFELQYDKSNCEISVNNMFIKGFKPGYSRAFKDAFEISYDRSGEKLTYKDFAEVLKEVKTDRLSEIVRNVFDTIDFETAKWWYPICESYQLKCEKSYWADASEEFKLTKYPQSYEWDYCERGVLAKDFL